MMFITETGMKDECLKRQATVARYNNSHSVVLISFCTSFHFTHFSFFLNFLFCAVLFCSRFILLISCCYSLKNIKKKKKRKFVIMFHIDNNGSNQGTIQWKIRRKKLFFLLSFFLYLRIFLSLVHSLFDNRSNNSNNMLITYCEHVYK